jgi:biopolymer transport protein ExbD
MGALDAGEGRQQPQKKGGGLHHIKRRAGVRIDMTPMVDIAFLLLIFFMVTTVFRKPQAMEMNLPPHDVKVKVAESSVMTVFVDQNDRVFYRYANDPLAPVERKQLVPFFKTEAAKSDKLIILVKLDRAAKYETMVNVLDDLEFADMKRFSLIPMTEEDLNLVMAQP